MAKHKQLVRGLVTWAKRPVAWLVVRLAAFRRSTLSLRHFSFRRLSPNLRNLSFRRPAMALRHLSFRRSVLNRLQDYSDHAASTKGNKRSSTTTSGFQVKSSLLSIALTKLRIIAKPQSTRGLATRLTIAAITIAYITSQLLPTATVVAMSISKGSDTDFTSGSFTDTAVTSTGTSAGIKLAGNGGPDGTKYKRQVNISNTSGLTLTDYQVLIDEGEVGYWNMDETNGMNVSDISGNANNGTATGTTIVDGKYGKARSFNGSSDQVAISDQQLPIGNSARTFSLWFKPRIAQNKSLVGYGTASQGQMFDIMLYNGKVMLHLYGSESYSQAPSYSVGEWQNIALTYDGTSLKHYFNGSYFGQTNISLNTINSGQFFIGSGINYKCFDGLIDGVRIYNRALSSTDVQSLYANDRSPLLDTVYSHTQENGADLRFRDSTDTQNLSYWVEKYTAAGQNAKIWVKVPTIPSVGGSVNFYYGNPSINTQSSPTPTFIREISNVSGAWNLDESAVGTIYDSSGNSKNGTSNGTAVGPMGKFGRARGFAGNGNYISTTFTPGSVLAVSAWATHYGGAENMLFKVNGGGTYGPDLFYSAGRLSLNTGDGPYGNTFCNAPANLNDGSYHHYMVLIATTNTSLYIDNVLCGTANYRLPTGTSLNISSGSGYDWYGNIDHFRVYSSLLSTQDIADIFSNYGYVTPNYPGKELVRKWAYAAGQTTGGEGVAVSGFGNEIILLTPSGSWQSPSSTPGVYDLVWNGGWGDGTASSPAFTATVANVSATDTITFALRTAPSIAELAAAPYATIGTANTGTTFTATKAQLDTAGVGTGTNRYLQVKATFAQTSGTSPQLDDFAIHYLSDVTAPAVNASAITAAISTGGSVLADNAWTNNPHPSFTWTAGQDGDSGILGYCLYIGQDGAANPATTKGLLGTSPLETAGKCPFAVAATNFDTSIADALASPLLTSKNPYYFHIKAIDLAGNIYAGSQASYSFRFDNTSPTNPAFISAPSQFIATKDVTVTWPTSGNQAATDDTSGLVGLQYKIGFNGTWYGLSHNGKQDISDIIPLAAGSYQTDNTYDYPLLADGNNMIYFRAIDNAGNTSSSLTSAVIKLNTASPSSPQDISVAPGTNTTNSFAFNWNAPATYVGQAANIKYCYTINTLPTENTYTWTAAGQTSLAAGAYATQPGDNTFYVVAKDEAGNINYATAASITFKANTSAPGIPLSLDIADISVKAAQDWKLALSWMEPTDTGAGVAQYRIYRSTSPASNFIQIATTAGLGYFDAKLGQTTYYYKVRACDSANNCGAETTVVSKLPTGRYTTPAELSGTPNVSVSSRKAVIKWYTARESDSKVQVGTKSGYYQPTESGISTQTKAHQIELTNLDPGTTYYYKAKWTDEDGNTGSSSELMFTTLPAPIIKDLSVIKKNLTSVTIQFTTTDATSVSIAYGKGDSLVASKVVSTSTVKSTYSVEITGLEDGVQYGLRPDGIDADGHIYTGNVISFTTPPRPRISNLRFQPIPGEPTSTQRVTWKTNVPTTSQVTYGIDGTNGQEALDSKLVTDHSITIRNLKDDSSYFLLAQSRDADGNIALSDKQTFRTALDTRPPKISDVYIETAIKGTGTEAKGQIVVTWKTDEPTTSQVAFSLGGNNGTYTDSTLDDTRLLTEHTVIISNLRTSSVYYLKPLSRDSAGNQAATSEESAIIGRPTDNVLTIILNALYRTFGL